MEEVTSNTPPVIGTQVLNFLWLGLDLPAKPDLEDGSIRTPLPEEYIENVREAGKRHPRAEINLWVDSKRLTVRQKAYLQCVLEEDAPNVHLRDLRSIPEYDSEELFNRAETKKDWRSSYRANIWLQVDAAKILISLQGDFDQHFFADLDHAHVDIESGAVQGMIGKHGLMIGSAGPSYASMENQLWGYNRSRRVFFEEYYREAMVDAYKGTYGFSTLCGKVQRELTARDFYIGADGKMKDSAGLSEREFVLPIGDKGLSHAIQPGHEWSGVGVYSGQKCDKQRPKIPGEEISAVFKKVSGRVDVPAGVAIAVAIIEEVPAAVPAQQDSVPQKEGAVAFNDVAKKQTVPDIYSITTAQKSPPPFFIPCG